MQQTRLSHEKQLTRKLITGTSSTISAPLSLAQSSHSAGFGLIQCTQYPNQLIEALIKAPWTIHSHKT